MVARPIRTQAFAKAKDSGVLDFSHPIVVRCMGLIDDEAARQDGSARAKARDEANSKLAQRAAARRREAHQHLLPGGAGGRGATA